MNPTAICRTCRCLQSRSIKRVCRLASTKLNREDRWPAGMGTVGDLRNFVATLQRTELISKLQSCFASGRASYRCQRIFFNGLGDPLTLIKKYKEPLERLAFR